MRTGTGFTTTIEPYTAPQRSRRTGADRGGAQLLPGPSQPLDLLLPPLYFMG